MGRCHGKFSKSMSVNTFLDIEIEISQHERAGSDQRIINEYFEQGLAVIVLLM